MSVPYKKKPARIKDKVRKIWKKATGQKSVSGFASTVGHGGTATGFNDGTVPYKKKPPRKGRPD